MLLLTKRSGVRHDKEAEKLPWSAVEEAAYIPLSQSFDARG
jgi:hypothetical protein